VHAIVVFELSGSLVCICVTARSLDVTKFRPTKQHMKALKRMEQYLSGERPITKMSKVAAPSSYVHAPFAPRFGEVSSQARSRNLSLAFFTCAVTWDQTTQRLSRRCPGSRRSTFVPPSATACLLRYRPASSQARSLSTQRTFLAKT
jgi:hypothetical protein